MGAGGSVVMPSGVADFDKAAVQELLGDAFTEALQAKFDEKATDGKISAALLITAMYGPWGQQGGTTSLTAGLCDCVTGNPGMYKVVAEAGSARLVLMELAPGEKDEPHSHPIHPMYVITGGKLKIQNFTNELDADGKPVPAGEPMEAEMPDGAAPIMPAGAHQVENIGDAAVKILFLEELPTCPSESDAVEGFVSPFGDAGCGCYEKVSSGETITGEAYTDWFTGLMSMTPGQKDLPHHHRDHFIYVLKADAPAEGETAAELTIHFPGGTETPEDSATWAGAKKVPPTPGMAVPATMNLPPFAYHYLENTGGKDVKLVFFERAK